MAGRRATDKLRAEWFWADRWTTSRGHTLPVGPRGVYREMLTQAWLREAKLPNDHEEICRICAFTKKEWKACWPTVEPFWMIDGAFLVNVTQVVVYLEAKEAAAKSTMRAQAGAHAMHERRRSKAVSSAQALPSVSVSEPLSGKNPESARAAHTGSGAMAGELPRDHLRHSVCGRMCLHEKQFAEFVQKIGGGKEAATEKVRAWGESVLREWGDDGPKANATIQGTSWQFWNVRYEEWQGSPKAAKGAEKLPAPLPWICTAHNPPCAIQWRCEQLIAIAAEKAPLAIDLFCGLAAGRKGCWRKAIAWSASTTSARLRRGAVSGAARDSGRADDSRRQFKDAALIVASPPCQAYSYRAMPWKRAKALPPPDNSSSRRAFGFSGKRARRRAVHSARGGERLRRAEVGRARTVALRELLSVGRRAGADADHAEARQGADDGRGLVSARSSEARSRVGVQRTRGSQSAAGRWREGWRSKQGSSERRP
jgi:uncharacterized protein YdaU (DUF1376 family)